MSLCRVYQIAVQVSFVCCFCFIFQAHFTQGSTETPPLILVSPSVSSGQINGSVLTLPNTTSVIPTISAANINNTAQSLPSSFKAPTPKTAYTKHTTPKQAPTKDSGRKFDGLSFFGGIILGAVIVTIVLFSVKFYQAKKRSYHSL